MSTAFPAFFHVPVCKLNSRPAPAKFSINGVLNGEGVTSPFQRAVGISDPGEGLLILDRFDPEAFYFEYVKRRRNLHISTMSFII